MSSNIDAGLHNNQSQPQAEMTKRQVIGRLPRVGLRSGRGKTYSLAERLASRTIKSADPNGCWNVQGARVGGNGYGQIMRDSQSRELIYAHRAAWELANGPVPSGLTVMHCCDNPRCVNPSHLQLGTQAENVRDSIRKGRHSLWRVTGVRLDGRPVKERL